MDSFVAFIFVLETAMTSMSLVVYLNKVCFGKKKDYRFSIQPFPGRSQVHRIVRIIDIDHNHHDVMLLEEGSLTVSVSVSLFIRSHPPSLRAGYRDWNDWLTPSFYYPRGILTKSLPHLGLLTKTRCRVIWQGLDYRYNVCCVLSNAHIWNWSNGS